MPARPSALARRRARFIIEDPGPQDAILRNLSEEIMGLTISDEGPEAASQLSKLWVSREEFQDTRPLLERVPTSSLNNAIGETLQLSTASVLPSNTSIPSFNTVSQPAASTALFSGQSISPPPTPSIAGPHWPSIPPPGQPSIPPLPGISFPPPQAGEPSTPPLHTSSNSPILRQIPVSSILCGVERRQPQTFSMPIQGVSHTSELPTRLPRRTAAQKVIEGHLQAAISIGLDLDGCEEMTSQEPTLDLYYQLRRLLCNAEKSIQLLSHRDAAVQQAHDDLLSRHMHISKTLVTWQELVCVPDEPRIVDTSKFFIYQAALNLY